MGQRIKSEEIKADDRGQMADDSKAVKTTTFLMSGMVEQARMCWVVVVVVWVVVVVACYVIVNE